MTWQLGSKPGVIDAVDRFGRPMAVPLPERCDTCPGNCYRPACPHLVVSVHSESVHSEVPRARAFSRVWCELGKGPCNGDCYGSECELSLATANAITEPGDLAPEREQRMPVGVQLAIATIAGVAVGSLGALAWELVR